MGTSYDKKRVGPEVSVLMPAYNVEAFIGEAITSCLAQTIDSLELIVVDDGSTDGTAAIVEGFSDPRVRLIRTAANRGEAHARNRALDAAAGTWITLLDADDLWEDRRLEELLSLGTRFGEHSVLFDISLPFVVDRAGHHRRLPVKHGSHRSEPYEEDTVELDATEFVRKGRAGHPMFSRSLVATTRASYPVGVRVGADIAFYVQLLNAEHVRVIRVNRALYHYRVRPGAATGAADRLKEIRRAYEFLLKECALRTEMQAAIEYRLIVLKRETEYARLLENIGKAQWRTALRLLRSDPSLASSVAQRAIRSLRYRLRLATWGSEGRG